MKAKEIKCIECEHAQIMEISEGVINVICRAEKSAVLLPNSNLCNNQHPNIKECNMFTPINDGK